MHHLQGFDEVRMHPYNYPLHCKLLKHFIYVIDYMRTRFVHALLVTICAFLAIKNFARFDAYCARVVGAILRIVSDFPRTVRPKLADTKCCRSFVTMTPFSCVIMGEFLFSRIMFADSDRHSRTDIQVELQHFSNRDLYLLTIRASI